MVIQVIQIIGLFFVMSDLSAAAAEDKGLFSFIELFQRFPITEESPSVKSPHYVDRVTIAGERFNVKIASSINNRNLRRKKIVGMDHYASVSVFRVNKDPLSQLKERISVRTWFNQKKGDSKASASFIDVDFKGMVSEKNFILTAYAVLQLLAVTKIEETLNPTETFQFISPKCIEACSDPSVSEKFEKLQELTEVASDLSKFLGFEACFQEKDFDPEGGLSQGVTMFSTWQKAKIDPRLLDYLDQYQEGSPIMAKREKIIKEWLRGWGRAAVMFTDKVIEED